MKLKIAYILVVLMLITNSSFAQVCDLDPEEKKFCPPGQLCHRGNCVSPKEMTVEDLQDYRDEIAEAKQKFEENKGELKMNSKLRKVGKTVKLKKKK